MIDPRYDKLIPLRRVPSLPWMPRPRGTPLHLSTIYRWRQRGSRGKKLESVTIGGTVYTTEAALLEFIQCESEGIETPPTSRTPRTTSWADDILDDEGV